MPRPTPASQKGTSLLPFYAVLGLVALAGAFFVLRKTTGGGGPVATQPVPVNLTPEQLARVQGISRGDPNAPITIFEFADYTCPACRNFTVFLEPVLRERLINSGKARFVFYDFPLGGTGGHKHGFVAARAARCAGDQNKFWEMHDALFTHQQDWAYSDDPTDLFLQYAGEAGIERGAFETCLRSDKYAREVSENKQFGLSLNVNSTPTLVANGQVLPPTFSFQSYDSFEALVRQVAPSVFAAPAAAPAESAAAPAAAPADSAAR